ncbi:MAG TPA: hypothetical protein ENJ38_11370 [Rhodospirillales bacterium]|nr:hypothetical protein [Rhodospirillales bacterium]
MSHVDSLVEQLRDLAGMLEDERPDWQQRQLMRRALDLVASALSLLDRELEELRATGGGADAQA